MRFFFSYYYYLFIFLLRNTVLQFKIAIIFCVFVFLDLHVKILMYNHYEKKTYYTAGAQDGDR